MCHVITCFNQILKFWKLLEAKFSAVQSFNFFAWVENTNVKVIEKFGYPIWWTWIQKHTNLLQSHKAPVDWWKKQIASFFVNFESASCNGIHRSKHFSQGWGGRGGVLPQIRVGPASDQGGGSHKFYHCRNPFPLNSRWGSIPPVPHSGSKHEWSWKLGKGKVLTWLIYH